MNSSFANIVYNLFFGFLTLLCTFFFFPMSASVGFGIALSALAILWANIALKKSKIVKIISVLYLVPLVYVSGVTFVIFFCSPLHYAVATNNTWLTSAFLFAGFDINIRRNAFKDSNATTPLEWASEAGANDIVALLIDRGASPIGGRSALAVAAREGHIETVRIFLEKGIDPNLHPQYSSPPIFAAIAYGALEKPPHGGQCEIVKLLIKHGADVNIRASPNTWQIAHNKLDTDTPLFRAAKMAHPCTFQALLHAGADPDIVVYGSTIEELLHKKGSESSSRKTENDINLKTLMAHKSAHR